MRNKFLIFTLAVLIFSSGLSAQINTSSPYSRFGIGEIANQNLGRSNGMGGISTGLRLPFEINTVNPASYSAIPSKVFLFQVGINAQRTDYSTSNIEAKNYDFNLASINAAFRVNKYWNMSFGLSPVSNVGYKIESFDTISNGDYSVPFKTVYIGEGGISKIYIGNSLSYKGLAIGFNAGYYFGTLSRRTESLLSDGSYQSYLKDVEDVKIKDFRFRLGMQYSDSIFKKITYTVGGFFENKGDLNADNIKFTSRSFSLTGDNTLTDTIISDTIKSGTIGMPMSYGFGFTIVTKQFLFGADMKVSNWKDILIFNEKKNYLTNSSRYSVGLEYTNDYTSKNFFKTINFRMGGYYGNTNLFLNNTQIKDMGVNFGIGIPTKIGTKINIAFGVGQRGTTNNNLIGERYYTIKLNLNLTDRWFIRRKFF